MQGVCHALLCASIAWSGEEPAAPPSTTQTDTAPIDEAAPGVPISALVVRVDGLAFAAFASAMQLRAPALRLHEVGHGDFERPQDALYAYAVIHSVEREAESWSVTVIVSDGRAFFRSVHASSDDIARVAATTVANLVAAAEGGSIPPDASRPMPSLDAASAPEVATPPTEPQAPPPPSPEIGVSADGAVLVGLGPPQDVEHFAGGGGALGLDVRLPSGGVLGVAVRGNGLVRHHHALSRLRAAVRGGYAWRRGAFELVAMGLVFAEPWFLTRNGERVEVEPASAPAHVLLGGGVRLAPGGLVTVGRTRLHLGVHVEAGASALPRGGIGRITVIDADGTSTRAFRAGGFELGIGIDLLWWIAVR